MYILHVLCGQYTQEQETQKNVIMSVSIASTHYHHMKRG